jgi:hypothetical protein
MDVIFRRLINNNLSELPGLTLDATVPVPERLVNEILVAALQDNQNIESCQVSIGSQNRVTMNVKTPLWPWPLNLKLKLFGSVDFSGSPKVRAFLENNILLGRLGAIFKALPEGIVLYKDQVSVDIGSFLQTAEQKRILELIKAVDIRTEEHRIIFDVKAAS